MNAALRALGADPNLWEVVEENREKPDFKIKTPDGVIGFELSELLSSDYGAHRASEHDLALTASRVVKRFLLAQGGTGGGLIVGNAAGSPHRADVNMPEFERKLEQHLEIHGEPLAKDRGVLCECFRYAYGSISEIERVDSDTEVRRMHDGMGRPPLHKRGVGREELEGAIVDRVRSKCRKASGYDRRDPLWLALRNPHDRVARLSQRCATEVLDINQGVFERIFVFNDPEDVLDARPPEPQVVHILPAR